MTGQTPGANDKYKFPLSRRPSGHESSPDELFKEGEMYWRANYPWEASHRWRQALDLEGDNQYLQAPPIILARIGAVYCRYDIEKASRFFGFAHLNALSSPDSKALMDEISATIEWGLADARDDHPGNPVEFVAARLGSDVSQEHRLDQSGSSTA